VDLFEGVEKFIVLLLLRESFVPLAANFIELPAIELRMETLYRLIRQFGS